MGLSELYNPLDTRYDNSLYNTKQTEGLLTITITGLVNNAYYSSRA